VIAAKRSMNCCKPVLSAAHNENGQGKSPALNILMEDVEAMGLLKMDFLVCCLNLT